MTAAAAIKAAFEMPRIRSYGEYSGRGYGAHCLMVEVGGRTLYFSYETLVAFEGRDGRRVVRENSWGPTTGKHLNWIDGGDRKGRVSAEAFAAAWAEEVEKG